jgi:hypothetical protein
MHTVMLEIQRLRYNHTELNNHKPLSTALR